MRSERWADLAEDDEAHDAVADPAVQSERGRRCGARVQRAERAERATQRAARAAADGPVLREGARAAAEGRVRTMGDQVRAGAGGGQVQARAGAGLQPGGFRPLQEAYEAFLAMDEEARTRYLADRKSWKPQAGSPCGLAPSDIAVFALVYEIIRKLAHTLIIGRFFGTQEELGIACISNAFTGDAEAIAQTAINDAPPSNDRVYRLSSVLRAILRAYLPPRAAQEWRSKCRDFVWPPVFARGWADVVRLVDVGTAIAALTATDPLPVKRLPAPSFDDLTQLLEDVGPSWMVAALYVPPAAQTRDALQHNLAIKDPGCDPAHSSGGLAALRAQTTSGCFICGGRHLARECPHKPSRQTGGDMQSRAPINMLAAQEESLVASLQTQLHLQNQLLAAHARIDQHEDRLASLFSSPAGAALTSSPAGAALSKGDGPSVASLAQSGGNLPPFRVGGVERPGYEYIGINSGVPIWGRQDVVRDSVNAHADE